MNELFSKRNDTHISTLFYVYCTTTYSQLSKPCEFMRYASYVRKENERVDIYMWMREKKESWNLTKYLPNFSSRMMLNSSVKWTENSHKLFTEFIIFKKHIEEEVVEIFLMHIILNKTQKMKKKIHFYLFAGARLWKIFSTFDFKRESCRNAIKTCYILYKPFLCRLQKYFTFSPRLNWREIYMQAHK
jgi:hypothetical protein